MAIVIIQPSPTHRVTLYTAEIRRVFMHDNDGAPLMITTISNDFELPMSRPRERDGYLPPMDEEMAREVRKRIRDVRGMWWEFDRGRRLQLMRDLDHWANNPDEQVVTWELLPSDDARVLELAVNAPGILNEWAMPWTTGQIEKPTHVWIRESSTERRSR